MKSVGGVEGDEFLYFWEPVVGGSFYHRTGCIVSPKFVVVLRSFRYDSSQIMMTCMSKGRERKASERCGCGWWEQMQARGLVLF